MKKFTLLLALIALFAMSASAFAATSNDIVGLAIYDEVVTNVTAVPEGKIYFLAGAASGDAVIDLEVTVADADGASFDVITMTRDFKGLNPSVGDITITSDDIDVDGGVYELVIKITSIDLTLADSRDIQLKIAISDDDAASQDIKATLTEVEPTLALDTFVVGRRGDVTLEFANNVAFEVEGSVDVKADPASADVRFVSGDIVLSNVTAEAGETISIDITVSKDHLLADAKGIRVIGFDGLDQKTFTVALSVVPDKNAKLAADVKAEAEELGIMLGDYQPYDQKEITSLNGMQKAALIEALSSDMSGRSNEVLDSRVVKVDLVSSGGYTVVASVDVITGIGSEDLKSADSLIDFYKVFSFKPDAPGSFVPIGDPQLVQDHESGVTTFGYDLVVIDGPAPDEYAIEHQSGVSVGKPGMMIRDATKRLYVWDGLEDRTAFDPIVAVRSQTDGGSSSGACSAGLGLAVIEGLAALALRKRSK